MKKTNQDGIAHIALVLVILVVAIVGLVGWRVTQGKSEPSNSSPSGSSSNKSSSDAKTSDLVTWEWGGEKWIAYGTPPACPNPLSFSQSPTDISKVVSVLYPGQQRSSGYKPHGGFRLADSNTGAATVKMPIDAKLVHGSRYIEMGETQYMFFFETSCGLAFRFDHLLTLDPKFQAIADTLPAAKQDDSRTTKFDKPQSFKAGDVVATAVGFPKINNISFDFGVYDLRQRNAAASDSSYVSKHQNELSQAAYGLCWFDLLPANDAATVKGLPSTDQASGKKSDYCK